MPAPGYKNVGIPTSLFERIDWLVKRWPEFGKNVAEFVRFAAMDRLKDVYDLLSLKPEPVLLQEKEDEDRR